MRTSIFPARFENLDDIREYVGQAARDIGMSDDEVFDVQLAVDEACSNIIEHAYGLDAEGEIECICSGTQDGLTIVLRDHGKPFDMSEVPEPNLCLALEKRPVGGLGIYLMRKKMDEIHYEALGEVGNMLTMKKQRKKDK